MQQLSKGALDLLIALQMADLSPKLIRLSKKKPQPNNKTQSVMLQCKFSNKREKEICFNPKDEMLAFL